MYRDAISQYHKHYEENGISHGEDVFNFTAYQQACALFKLLLAKSSDLGKQVRMQFNKVGMKVEIGVRWLCASWPFLCGRGVF